MKYSEFERIISDKRLIRYLTACNTSSKQAMTLYRKNLKLSQELFTIISCFEVALRNNINRVFTSHHGLNWLFDSAQAGGCFDRHNCRITQNIIIKSIQQQGVIYSHDKLIASLDFGFWRYLFAQPQFHAGGQILLRVFPSKPLSTPAIQYNHSYIFNELAKINEIRNRIAHHEPICFIPGVPVKNTTYIRRNYNLILQLFQWMNIDEKTLLYGLDHVDDICNEIDNL